MSEPRNWINALLVTGLLGFTLQGHADDGGKPRGEPPQVGSISKMVLHAGQEGENLLIPTAPHELFPWEYALKRKPPPNPWHRSWMPEELFLQRCA